MKKRIAVVAFLLSMAVTSTAMADLSLGMGTRWTATRWYNPVWAGDVSMAGNHFINNSESALDAYFMLAFSKKFGLYLQIDYLSMSWACTGADNDDDACSGGSDDTGDMAFSSFGFELGMKYYFAEPRRASISPMLTAGFFKYFASVTDGEAPEDDQFALGDLSSPLGGRLAIGVEYNFSNNFSIGAEIFGFKVAYAATSTVATDQEASTTVAFNSDTDYLSISMYTALTLNFRFYGLFRVYTREEEEQGRQEEAEDRQENQQWQQQQNQGWQQDQGQQQQNQQWQQQQQPQNQQWQQQPPQNQQWQQQPPPQDPNQQWQQPQGGGTAPPPVQ